VLATSARQTTLEGTSFNPQVHSDRNPLSTLPIEKLEVLMDMYPNPSMEVIGDWASRLGVDSSNVSTWVRLRKSKVPTAGSSQNHDDSQQPERVSGADHSHYVESSGSFSTLTNALGSGQGYGGPAEGLAPQGVENTAPGGPLSEHPPSARCVAFDPT